MINGWNCGELCLKLTLYVFKRPTYILHLSLLFNYMHKVTISIFLMVLPSSAGVCTAIRHALDVNVVKLEGVPGRLLVLDLSKDNETLCILNIYTPNDICDCRLFFFDFDKMIMDCCMVLGDFNSVTDVKDCLSGHLDSTSSQLKSLLFDYSLEEPRGSHT